MLAEKDIIMGLIHSEDEIDLVLRMLKKSTKHGSIPFKRNSLSNALSSSNRYPALKTLKEHLALSSLENQSISYTLDYFQKPTRHTPNIVQYFTLLHYHEDFINEHLEEMSSNITNQIYFLDGLNTFQTLEEVETFYNLKATQSEFGYDDEVMKLIKKWFYKKIGPLHEEMEALTGKDLLFFHNYFQTYQLPYSVLNKFPDDFLLAPDLLDKLQVKASQLLVFIAFYFKGVMTPHIRHIIFTDCFSCFYQLESIISDEQTKQLKQHFQQKLRENKQEIDHLKKENKRLERDFKRQENMQIVSQKKLETHLEKESQYKQHLTNLQLHFNETYTKYKIVVVCSQQLLYVKHLFPDLLFVSEDEAISTRLHCRHLILLHATLMKSKRLQLEYKYQQYAQIKVLMSLDERELITDLLTYLKTIESGDLNVSL